MSIRTARSGWRGRWLLATVLVSFGWLSTLVIDDVDDDRLALALKLVVVLVVASPFAIGLARLIRCTIRAARQGWVEGGQPPGARS